jgi:hypothetical protein
VARRTSSAGQRAAIIRHAWLSYHAGRITFAELARTLATFRP